MQDYEIELELTDRMLLDVIVRLKVQDDTLTFRKSCREGVCGSDVMNINGRNGLACITPVRQLKEPVELRPLPSFPVIRDLVVDMTRFFKQYHSIKPYVIANEPAPEKEHLQLPQDREKLNGLYECILCACCTSQCPSSWWNPDKFVGPASPNLGWRNASFRGYADYMQTSEFTENLAGLMELAKQERVALMCAEAVPWRCHRSLIADALVAHGIRVEEILNGTRRQVHALTPFASVAGTVITYPPSDALERAKPGINL